MKPKPTVGIYSLTSCEGCQVSILNLEENFLKLCSAADIRIFPLLKEKDYEGPVDIAVVEGTVVRTDEIEIIKKIRSNCKTLVALGTCATYGGIASIRDFTDKSRAMTCVYPDPLFLKSIHNVRGLDCYVKVDYALRGCPIVAEEFVRVMTDLVLGKTPVIHEEPVCVECKKNKNICFLLKGEKCLGPVTYGDCNSICINEGRPCYGCRGPLKNANVDALMRLFRRHKIPFSDVKHSFTVFAGTSKRYNKGVLK
jgi:sulfhydrogenase subunit delta